MKLKIMAMCVALFCCCGGAWGVRAQQAGAQQDAGSERRVALEEQPVALDSMGRAALSGQLLTRALSGTPDAPVKNARFIVENRSPFFYTYVTGSVTFYDERGVRCGEGLFTLSSLAPNEQAETDAPGLRLFCSPRSWRIVANNLLTRTSETAKPVQQTAEQSQPPPEPIEPAATPALLPLEIVVDGKVYSAPLGSTLEIPVRRRMVTITVRSAQ